jgi:hypothetical protein
MVRSAAPNWELPSRSLLVHADAVVGSGAGASTLATSVG